MKKAKTVKPAKSKAPAASYPVPQNDAEAAAAIAEIGRLQHQADAIGLRVKAASALLVAQADVELQRVKATHGATLASLQIYCEANRARLTEDGKVKTAKFNTGSVAWRWRPPRVTIKGAAEAVILEIKRKGLRQFLRFAEPTINREAMRDDPETARTIEGVSVGSAGEDFIVEPEQPEMKETAS